MPPTDQDTAISLALLEREMEHMKLAMADLKYSNARQDAKLDEITKKLNEANGGWRVLMLLGGAAGTVGAFIAWIVSNWKG